MVKVVLTGGPCAGKSTGLAQIERILTERGYKVLVVAETATELITSGYKIGDEIDAYNFQTILFEKQTAKEKLYDEISKKYSSDKIVILYDRGIMDALAFCPKEIMQRIFREHNVTESEIMARYDGVIHMVTAADGAEQYYVYGESAAAKGNNGVRKETPAEARIADKRCMVAWCGHPHLRVVDNKRGFAQKIKTVVDEILNLLGEPIPTEIERKYLIQRPTEEVLQELQCSNVADIVQVYLNSIDENVERRIRQRGTKETGYTCYYTEKIAVSTGERIEYETKIDQKQYIDYMTEADYRRKPIIKKRYCFVYKNQYFELDVYPFSETKAILEIELPTIDTKVYLPKFINVIADVTGDARYSNCNLAQQNEL